jgi:hypothetical protein
VCVNWCSPSPVLICSSLNSGALRPALVGASCPPRMQLRAVQEDTVRACVPACVCG